MEVPGRKILKLRKGQVLFKEGDESGCMFEVLEGGIGIYARYGSAEEKRLARLSQGDFFGEMGLIDNEPRSSTAVAMHGGAVVEVITMESFEGKIVGTESKALDVISHMSHRLRRLTRDYMRACRAAAEMVDNADDAKRPEWFNECVERFVNSTPESSDTL